MCLTPLNAHVIGLVVANCYCDVFREDVVPFILDVIKHNWRHILVVVVSMMFQICNGLVR